MMNFKSHRTWLLISYLMLMILNSLFSFISSNYIWRYDKIVHFSEYFILGVLFFYVLYEQPFSTKKFVFYICFLSTIPIVDESLQYFAELWGQKRIPSIYDALADYLGCYTGCFIYYITNKGFNG